MGLPEMTARSPVLELNPFLGSRGVYTGYPLDPITPGPSHTEASCPVTQPQPQGAVWPQVGRFPPCPVGQQGFGVPHCLLWALICILKQGQFCTPSPAVTDGPEHSWGRSGFCQSPGRVQRRLRQGQPALSWGTSPPMFSAHHSGGGYSCRGSGGSPLLCISHQRSSVRHYWEIWGGS